jgi:hypothetical protein
VVICGSAGSCLGPISGTEPLRRRKTKGHQVRLNVTSTPMASTRLMRPIRCRPSCLQSARLSPPLLMPGSAINSGSSVSLITATRGSNDRPSGRVRFTVSGRRGGSNIGRQATLRRGGPKARQQRVSDANSRMSASVPVIDFGARNREVRVTSVSGHPQLGHLCPTSADIFAKVENRKT